jgi:hypothetical protein
MSGGFASLPNSPTGPKPLVYFTRKMSGTYVYDPNSDTISTLSPTTLNIATALSSLLDPSTLYLAGLFGTGVTLLNQTLLSFSFSNLTTTVTTNDMASQYSTSDSTTDMVLGAISIPCNSLQDSFSVLNSFTDGISFWFGNPFGFLKPISLYL